MYKFLLVIGRVQSESIFVKFSIISLVKSNNEGDKGALTLSQWVCHGEDLCISVNIVFDKEFPELF